MSAPICHRTIDGSGTLPRDEHVPRFSCAGSLCALWVPDMAPPDSVLGSVLRPAPEGYSPSDGGTHQGMGRCADNLRREPWKDPAA